MILDVSSYTIFQVNGKHILLNPARHDGGLDVSIWGSVAIDPTLWELTITTDFLPLFVEQGDDEGRVIGPLLALDVLATWPGLTLYPGEPGDSLEDCDDWGRVMSAYVAVLEN